MSSPSVSAFVLASSSASVPAFSSFGLSNKYLYFYELYTSENKDENFLINAPFNIKTFDEFIYYNKDYKTDKEYKKHKSKILNELSFKKHNLYYDVLSIEYKDEIRNDFYNKCSFIHEKKFNKCVKQMIYNNLDLFNLLYEYNDERLNLILKGKIKYNDNIESEIYIFNTEYEDKDYKIFQIIKFIISLIYYDEYDNTKENILLSLFHMFQKKFKFDFFLIPPENEQRKKQINFIEINKLLYMFLGSDKIPDIEINKINIVECEKIKFECNICTEEKEEDEKNKVNCLCSVKICIECYNQLINKCCPLCRRQNPEFKKIENNNNTNKIIIRKLYNNKIYEYETEYNLMEDENINIVYFDNKKKSFENFDLKLDNLRNIKSKFYDRLKYEIMHYNTDFLIHKLNLQLSTKLRRLLIETLKENDNDSSNEIIFSLLGLSYNLDYEEMRRDYNENEKFNDIYSELINCDGFNLILDHTEYYNEMLENGLNNYEYEGEEEDDDNLKILYTYENIFNNSKLFSNCGYDEDIKKLVKSDTFLLKYNIYNIDIAK
jgi:hypothetical protein